MSSEAIAEFLALKRAVDVVESQLQSAGCLPSDGGPLAALGEAFQRFMEQNRRREKLIQSRDECRAALQACGRMDAGVRQSVLMALDTLELRTSAKLEVVEPLITAATQTAQAVNRLGDDVPERNRMSSMLAHDYACLKLLYGLNAMDAAAPGAAVAASASAPAPVASPAPAGASAAAPVTAAPPPGKPPAAAPTSANGSADNSQVIYFRGQALRRMNT